MSARERDEIALALRVNPSVAWAEIARIVGRHPGTIGREVVRNGARGGYRAIVSHAHAAVCRRRSRQRRLAVAGGLRDRVTRELRAGRSPGGDLVETVPAGAALSTAEFGGGSLGDGFFSRVGSGGALRVVLRG